MQGHPLTSVATRPRANILYHSVLPHKCAARALVTSCPPSPFIMSASAANVAFVLPLHDEFNHIRTTRPVPHTASRTMIPEIRFFGHHETVSKRMEHIRENRATFCDKVRPMRHGAHHASSLRDAKAPRRVRVLPPKETLFGHIVRLHYPNE